MKIVYLILLAFCASALGNVARFPYHSKRRNFKIIADGFSEDIAYLRDDIEDVVRRISETRDRLMYYDLGVDLIISQKHEILKVQKMMDRADSNGKDVKLCNEEFLEYLSRITKSLTSYFHELVNTEIDLMTISVNVTNTNLKKLESVITDNSPMFIEQCKIDKSQCTKADIFFEEINEQVQYSANEIENINSRLAELIGSSYVKVSKHILTDRTDIELERVTECLEKIELVDYLKN